ncbi:MAG TPA: acyl-CoA dehydrogenase [Planctomycetes bacterium]|nr:acyl-CoA dehydrogenase [Planctomycetota bacterium]
MSYLETLEPIARDVVAQHAPAVDGEGRFPRESVDALGAAGLLGLLSATDVGGLGLGPAAAVRVIERLAQECGSTAMVTTMHYAGTAVVEAFGPEDVRRGLATGERFTTLAFSEAGSRSHFWAPLSTARQENGHVVLDAKKSWITSARQATDYVWSSKPLAGEEASTIWLVPAKSEGLSVPRPFDGLGLRGNDSTPVTAEGVKVAPEARLGEDGGGFGVMMGTVLPRFNLMIAAGALGLASGALKRAIAHVSATRYAHLGSSLADLPTIRAYVARMQIKTDMTRTLLHDAAAAVEGGREDAMLRVLESKAAAGETALEVTDLAMRVCGGQAFRKDVGVERLFRDARAASVMAPTTDQLYDFIGKAVCGLDLF